MACLSAAHPIVKTTSQLYLSSNSFMPSFNDSRKRCIPHQRTCMAHELHALFAAAVSTSLLFGSSLASAQQAPRHDENTLQTLTVTAEKREESVQDVPSAISVLGGEQILDNSIGRSASEILNYVPNASAGTQQHGRPRWWIRGVGAGQQQIDFANPVGFYLDDVYISNASATGFPLFDIDRVEVLRGPQGTLWGKNTTGGAIDVISSKPAFTTDGYFKAEYGSFADSLVEGAIGGALNESTAARIAVHTENQGVGSFQNAFTGQTDGTLKDSAVRAQLLSVVNRDLTTILNVHYRDYQTAGAVSTVESYAPNGVYRASYIPSTDPSVVDSNAPAWSLIKQGGVNLNAQYQYGKYAITSITAYEDFYTTAIADGDNTPLEISRTYANASSRQLSQELRIASPREDRINWIGGFHYFDEDITSDSATARLPNGSVPALAGSTQPVGYSDSYYTHNTVSYAVFGSTTVNFSDKLLSTFGLRWTQETKALNLNRKQLGSTVQFGNTTNWWSAVSGGSTTGLSNNNFTSTPTTTWTGTSYDVTPEYKFSESVKGYFKYAHGIKSGGYNNAATDVRALDTLVPETLDDYELGFKSDFNNSTLRVNGSVFHYDYHNQQVNVVGLFDGTGTAVSYLQNVASSHVDGAEFDAEALIGKNLHVNADLGFLFTQFDDFNVLNGGSNLDGNQFVRSPHVTAVIGADYRIPLESGAAYVLGADAHYTADQYYYVDPQTSARSLLEQAPYTLVNARLSYHFADGKQSITGYVNNLNNTVYENHALTTFQSGVANGDTVYWGAPRTFGVNYIARF